VGDVFDLALVWQVAGAPPGDAILFAGLFDAGGERWAQTDERPLGSRYPVSEWATGSTVRTPLRIPVPPGTPPGTYRLEVGWYRFEDGQPVWLPWTGGERLFVAEVGVVAPPDWSQLPLPEMDYSAGVEMEGVRLLGFDSGSLEALPGGSLRLEIFWQALQDAPPAGLAVLQLADDGGQVLAESQASPAGGRAPFARLSAGQVVRAPRTFVLPAGLEPGVYDIRLGRRQADGRWLSPRRGLVRLGTTYPLATVRAVGRTASLESPAVQHSLGASLDLPQVLASGRYALLAGLHQETTGTRLSLYADPSQSLGDGHQLEQINLKE
jgi:hypothetical protein